MKKYKVKVYPNVEVYTTIVEAESVEEAIDIAEEICRNDTGFTAMPEDVEEIIEEEANNEKSI